ncbi:MAG: hypothetical protein Q4G04_04410 [bacterium]|nr:hypothetical protein [bacterium]
MYELQRTELAVVTGGWSFSASFLNYATKALNAVVDLGRTLGSAIRRIVTCNYC